jgi:hypothetical protein
MQSVRPDELDDQVMARKSDEAAGGKSKEAAACLGHDFKVQELPKTDTRIDLSLQVNTAYIHTHVHTHTYISFNHLRPTRECIHMQLRRTSSRPKASSIEDFLHIYVHTHIHTHIHTHTHTYMHTYAAEKDLLSTKGVVH